MRSITRNETVSELSALLKEIRVPEEIGLSGAALIQLIDRCLIGDLSVEQIVGIANLLEVNEAINVDEADRLVVAEAHFQLATPEINGQITQRRAQDIRAILVTKE